MKTFINKLVVLADNLDRLGLKKDANKIDRLIARAAHGEDFGDLMTLFDDPVIFEDTEEDGPGKRKSEEDPSEELDSGFSTIDPDEPITEKKTPNRLDDIKRRHELLKLKKSIDEAESIDENEDEEAPLELPIATPQDLAAFEDEDGDDVENEADDSLIDELQERLKSVPDLAKKLLILVRDNPELLELLAI